MNLALDPQTAAPDYTAIKQRQQTVWSSGDYAMIGTRLQIVGELLAEAVDLRADERVLDVAAGTGHMTLAAARRFAKVTSTDYVPELLDKARARVAADSLEAEYRVADAEKLPFADGEFDVVVSTFGVMFAPDQARAASEMLRALRPGGRIGLANWTPQGFIGQLFKVQSSHVAPPPGVPSPVKWGDESFIEQCFGPHAAQIRCERRDFMYRFRSPQHWLQVFRDYYGPTLKAFATLDESGKRALEKDILDLLSRMNIGDAQSLVVPAEYLEIVVTKR